MIEQKDLNAGSLSNLELRGNELSVTALKQRRYRLKDLIAEMSDGLSMVDGWDEMPLAGKEVDE